MSRRALVPLMMACLLAAPLVTLKVLRAQALLTPDTLAETVLVDRLTRDHFAVQAKATPYGRLLIQARRGTCQMELREVSPQGWDRSTIKKIAGIRDVFFIFRGDVFREQPVWKTWFYFHLRRFALFLGWSLPKRPIFAALSVGLCEAVDWPALAKS